MSLTIVLSGPKSSRSQVRHALGAEGFSVLDTEHDHGLDGEGSFVTVEGDDINLAHDTVAPLGWALRMHHDTPEPAPPSEWDELVSEIRSLRAELDELKAGK